MNVSSIKRGSDPKAILQKELIVVGGSSIERARLPGVGVCLLNFNKLII